MDRKRKGEEENAKLHKYEKKIKKLRQKIDKLSNKGSKVKSTTITETAEVHTEPKNGVDDTMITGNEYINNKKKWFFLLISAVSPTWGGIYRTLWVLWTRTKAILISF